MREFLESTLKLIHSLVRRSGATATTWTREASSVVKVTSFSQAYAGFKCGIILGTSIPSKGGGTTEIEIIISHQEYSRIMQAMMCADSEKTTEGYAEAVLGKVQQ